MAQMVKNLPALREMWGSIPGFGRSPGGEHGHPLQCPCLENPIRQRSLEGYSPWGHRVGQEIVALIKPQFEVGKGNAPGGLVRDEALRLEARDAIVRFATDELGLELLGLAESPIRGREMGNIEYLSYWRKTK